MHPTRILLHSFLCLSWVSSTFAAEPVRFIPITPDNTTLADGSPLDLKAGDWKWLPNEGNGGVFEVSGDPNENAAPLVTWADGLAPMVDYEIFGCFWALGMEKNGAINHGDYSARFGLGLATLRVFCPVERLAMPWVISPKSIISRRHGVWIHHGGAKTLGADSIGIHESDGSYQLVWARIGVARADANGKLPVFFDDFNFHFVRSHTRIDGLVIRKAEGTLHATAGAGKPQNLHLALRVGDHLSVERELAAGADVNTLDSDGLSPLFHPAALGDQAVVKRLLDAGADPNLKGQSVLVLTAAASVGDAEMVQLLLDHGAVAPNESLVAQPWMRKSMDVCHLHPAIAAARIGSLSSLKAILQKYPDLDLDKLGATSEKSDSIGGFRGTDSNKSSELLVEEAILSGHDELAAFLVDRGCSLGSKSTANWINWNTGAAFLTWCVVEGKVLERTTEALIRRGVPLVTPFRRNGSPQLRPWDALSAAVFVSNKGMVKRCLSGDPSVGILEQRKLCDLAHWAGDQKVLELIMEAFPDSRRPNIRQEAKHGANKNAESMRLLLPRTKIRPIENRGIKSDLTVAVLPGPNDSGQSALLEIVAANQSGWKVVDRQEIAAALMEKKLVDPWGSGVKRFADFGDQITADVLILVSQIKAERMSLLRFEAIDVETGLPVLREHMKSDSFGTDESAKNLLSRIGASIERARTGDRHIAISILPIVAEESVPNSKALESVLHAALEVQIDASPGIIALGNSEIQAIADEQRLGGKDGLWAAAYTIEGGLQKTEEGEVKLTLRLVSLEGDPSRKIDISETGRMDDIPMIVERSWKNFLESGELIKSRKPTPQRNRKQTQVEAERLLREGEWLVEMGMASNAIPLFERAELLGAPPEKLVGSHLAALANLLPTKRKGLNLGTYGDISGYANHPPITESQIDALCRSLPHAQALLDQTSYYLSRYGKVSTNWRDSSNQKPKSDIIDTIVLLSAMRAGMPIIPYDRSKSGEISKFFNSLDLLTKDYFRMRLLVNKPPTELVHAELGWLEACNGVILRRNPELVRGFVSILFRCSGQKINSRDEGLFQMTLEASPGIGRWHGRNRVILDEIYQRLGEYQGPHIELRRAELEVLRSGDEGHASAIRRYAVELAKLGHRQRIHEDLWLDSSFLNDYGTAKLLATTDWAPSLHHSLDSLIPSLLQEPVGSMDWITHPFYAFWSWKLDLMAKKPQEGWRNAGWTLQQEDLRKLAREASREPDLQVRLNAWLDAALMCESVHGCPIHDELRVEWSRLYPPSKDSGRPAGLKVPLLADLRSIDGFLPGMFRLPTIDSHKKDVLWCYYQPFEEKKNGITPSGKAIYPWRPPWILGVDMSTGKLETSVNLSKSSGFDVGATNFHQFSHDPRSGFIVQTKNQILTSAMWVCRGNSGTRELLEQAVLFEKKDGQIRELEESVFINPTVDMSSGDTYAYESLSAVAMDEDFYVLRPTKIREPFSLPTFSATFELVRIRSNGKLDELTKFGRRPELTPFDAKDRSPRTIFRDGRSLLVMRDKRHLGHFHPDSNDWSLAGDNAEQVAKHAHSIAIRKWRSCLFPHNSIALGNDKTMLVDFDNPLPDALTLNDLGGNRKHIHVDLEFPDGIFTQPVPGDPDKLGYATLKSTKITDAHAIVVLHQTKSDLILGMKVNKVIPECLCKRIEGFLPLLWKLPKTSLIEAINQ